jgi:hypothetical protein
MQGRAIGWCRSVLREAARAKWVHSACAAEASQNTFSEQFVVWRGG